MKPVVKSITPIVENSYKITVNYYYAKRLARAIANEIVEAKWDQSVYPSKSEGYSIEETSQIMAISNANVRITQHRAIKELRKILQKNS